MSRKAFTVAVVATTIAWSIGLSALLAPLSASAVTGGTLVKASLPAVYYVGSDLKRYVFPNEKTFKTWYADFSSVQTITDAELAALPIGGNVTYKPGAKMVKITTDPKVYAVDAHGTLRWVSSEAVAVALYGANWNQMIDDVPDAFFTNYTIGADITAASQFVPATVSGAASSINSDKNLGGVVAGGALSAMLSSSQPLGGTLPLEANGVIVLKADVRNGSSSAATVDSVTVKRVGPGSVDDFSAVYVYAGNDRLTSGRSLNGSTNDVTVGGLNLALAAGETKTLMIVVDIDAGAHVGDVNSFQLTALTAGSTSASGLPLSGPSFTLAGVHVGMVTIDRSGTISNPKAGQLGAKVASFTLEASNDEDLMVNKAVLSYSGEVDRSKLSNLVLKQSGAVKATVAALNSKDQAVFVLATPFALEKGTTRTFEVYSDVTGTAKAGESVEFYLDQPADLLAIGQTYGYGVTVDNGGYDGTPCDAGDHNVCSYSAVEAGKLTMTFNGPSAKDIGANAKDVELFNFTMAAAANLEIRETQLRIEVSGGELDKITDLKIVDTASGNVVAGPVAADSATVCGGDGDPCAFTEVYSLAAGQARTFKVTADVDKATTPDTTVKVTLLSFPENKVRNLDNSTYLQAGDMVPSGSLGGNTHTVKAPSLTLSRASSPVANQVFIQGANGAAILGLGLRAGAAGPVTVTSIEMQGAVEGSDACETVNATDYPVGDLVSTASLWNGSTQVGSTESPTSGSCATHEGGRLVFDNLNLVIPASGSVTLTLKVNLASGLNGLDLPLTVGFYVTEHNPVTTVHDVEAQDTDSNPIDIDDAVVAIAQEIEDAGSLSVTRSSDDTESEAGLLVGGASNAVLGKFKWTAQYEELKVTKLDVEVGDAIAVTALNLYDGSTQVAGPVSVDGGTGIAQFTGVNFTVPKDGSKVLTVKGSIAAVSASGAPIGSSAAVMLLDDNFEARGTSAGSNTLLDWAHITVTPGGNHLDGNAKYLVKSKPTVSLVALPTSVLSAGDQVVQRFTVAADAAGDVAFKQIVLSVGASGAVHVTSSGHNTTIKRVGGDYMNATVTVPGSPIEAESGQEVVIVLAAEEVVGAGTSKTFDVYMNMANAAGTDSVSSKLLGNTDFATGDFHSINYDEGGMFVWSDLSVVDHGEDSADWVNAFKVKTLPTDSQTLTK